MSLTNRVSTFFLAALGVILAVYSLVFYTVTREHLSAQFESELRGILNSLIAAAEVEETEVKWQPLEHAIDFGAHDEFGEVQWFVVGDEGLIVERSRYADADFVARATSTAAAPSAEDRSAVIEETTEGWAMMSQRVAAPRPLRQDRELDEFDQLTVFVGRSTMPRDAILFRLTLLVVFLPLLAWTLAAVLGRFVVRRALRPVSEMADQAKSITGNDFRARLRHPDSGDELTDLGTAFNHLLDRQQVAFEQQARFAGDAAHELRTPLTVLLGQIDVTLRRRRSEKEYQSNLTMLRTQTQTLQEIVESLLFLARSDNDSGSPPLRSLNLHDWIQTHGNTWAVSSRAADIQIDNQLDEPTWVHATPALLARIVDNLVGNALKYSQPDTPVIVRAQTSGSDALIEVLDSGDGIAPEDHSKLFDPFFRSKDARQRGIAGTGLGLAIASRIAETLGGSLRCESTPGRGSCFSLRLRCELDTSPSSESTY